MSSSQQSWESSSSFPAMAGEAANWYAVQTRARHEKIVAARLQEQGVESFLPTVTEMHRWSDRKKLVELPLFSCYVFAKMPPTNEARVQVYRTDGVFQIVGSRREGTPIPDSQIEGVRALVGQQLPWSIYPFLKIGQRVRVRGGAMDGVEGVLLARNGDRTLIISVDVIQRSLAVRIEGYDVEPL